MTTTAVDHRTFCRICTAMCGLVVTVDGGEVTSVRGDPDHPLSRGYTCEKGRGLGALHTAPNRLDHPLLGRPSDRRRTGWDELLDDLDARVGSVIDELGPDGVAMYLASGSAFDSAGRREAERFLRSIGSRQKYTATTIDTPCRPLVAEAMGGWSGLTPLWDGSDSGLLVLIGSNPVVSHGHSNGMPDPVRRLRDFRSRGGTIVVIDPRRTETASLANEHIALRPGSDHVLLAWTVRAVIDARSGSDLDDAVGVDELRDALEPLTIERVCGATDLDRSTVDGFVATVLAHRRPAVLTGTGTTMGRDAVATEHLAWALCVLTDSLDRPGGMWFNPGLFGRLDERDLATGDGTPGIGPPSRPDLPRRFDEWPCVGLLDEIEAGNVRALFVIGGNPALAFPDSERTRVALASLDVLAVADIVPTATTELATHVLPAVDPLERADATVMLDGYQPMVAGQYTARVVEPRAERRPVWWALGHLARRMGVDLLREDPDATTDESLLGPLLDRSRVGRDALMSAGTGVVASGPVHGWVHDRVLPDGRWRLAPSILIDAVRAALGREDDPSEPDDVVLVPHRRRSMMNSQFADRSRRTDETAAVRVHPDRAATLGADGALVRVTSSTGTVVGPLRIDATLRPDTITIGHGSSDCDVSRLTSATIDVDPLTGMVRQSGLRCRLEPGVDDRAPRGEIPFVGLASDTGDDVDVG